jgi:lipoprotein signal peptidase
MIEWKAILFAIAVMVIGWALGNAFDRMLHFDEYVKREELKS